MEIPRTVIMVGLALAAAACKAPPPRVYSSLEATPELHAVRPADIAVLPVEDATPDQSVGAAVHLVRTEIARALVERLYTPLNPAIVDEALRAQTAAPAVSVVDASWLKTVAGRFGEDATLAVRLTQWDQSSLMATGRVRFSADVAMVSAHSPNPLWQGALRGDVKAGGEGPAPLGRGARERSAAQEFARELIRLLPPRRP